ncbi:hypothetical protein IGI04_016403 [Brassica rapa subsp. trilocularis]|uniref:Phytocyanin domain-containing protein n=1 Tax=Brassica rapa subsp. trilocularis TaxID=1813537 RepID=A0ABQ7MVI4_BRACM|nr:hypothetical protein IGI04_016403 [Brassica rapa subsp. trilocularis]
MEILEKPHSFPLFRHLIAEIMGHLNLITGWSLINQIFIHFFLILVALFGVGVEGTVHKIGNSSGWTMMGVDYQAWASSRNFQVGDSLFFEYNNEFHDVTGVTPYDFELRFSPNPLATTKLD